MTADSVNIWGNWFLILSLIVGVLATYAIVVSGNIKEKGLKEELSKANTVAEKAKYDAANATQKAAEAHLRAKEIELENIKLRSNLENAVIEAEREKQKLSRLQIDVADARRKQAEAEKALELLKVAAKKVARGITSTYDFNGAKRDTTNGAFFVKSGDETVVFNKIIQLDRQRDDKGIIKLCKEQIIKTPEWLTPYMFLGMAQMNLNMRKDAIFNLEHVLGNAPGDPAYQQAEKWLHLLKGR